MTDRVPLNLRVPVRDVRAFEEALLRKFGQTESYAGMELERELRALLDMGGLSELEDAVMCVADTFGEDERKKQSKEKAATTSEVGGETTIVRFAVHETVRGRLKDAAEEYTVQSAGRLVGRVMRYYAEGGTIGYVTDKLREMVDSATDATATGTSDTDPDEDGGEDDRSTAERIADRLDPGFHLDGLIEAADAEGITTKTHVVEAYLPRVLDIKDAVPHPEAPDVFIPSDDAMAPDYPNPGDLPYRAMTDADKRTALVVAALQNGEGKKHSFLSLSDGAAVLHGSPRHATVRDLYDGIAAQHPGFFARKRGDDYQLIANMRDVRQACEERGALLEELRIAGLVDTLDETPGTPDQSDQRPRDDPGTAENADVRDESTADAPREIDKLDTTQAANVGRHLADD